MSSAVRLVFFAIILCRPGMARSVDNQFGGQDRADAAARMIVLGVEQAIASLPPVSGQAFTYEYDPVKDTYVRSKRLGPTALLSTQTVGEGRLDLRVAMSYFELADSFGPVAYFIQPTDPALADPRGFAKFGLSVQAKVGVVNLSGTYGITNRLDLTLSLPLVIVDAQASQTFTTSPNLLQVPAQNALVVGSITREGLDLKLRNGSLVFRTESFRDLGFDFNDGTSAGVGRISVGAKGVLYAGQHIRLAFVPEFFLPSPSENEFAGSASAALLPRLVAQVAVAQPLKLLADAGYDYDFSVAELRRFVWNTGATMPVYEWLTLDVGVGGSVFDTPIEWTPGVAHGRQTAQFPATSASVSENNTLGDTFVGFVGGIKFRFATNSVLAGTVAVPLNNEGFRPAALGTFAVEQCF